MSELLRHSTPSASHLVLVSRLTPAQNRQSWPGITGLHEPTTCKRRRTDLNLFSYPPVDLLDGDDFLVNQVNHQSSQRIRIRVVVPK